MLKITTTIILFLVGILTQAQVSGNRTLSDFSKIEVKNGISIVYSNDPNASAKVECGNNESLDNIIMDVKNGTLKIQTADNNPVKNVTVFINAKDVNAFTADSKASITLPQILETRSMDIILSNGAKFTGIIRATANTTVKVTDDAIFNGRIETGKLSGNFSEKASVILSGHAYETFIYTSSNAFVTARNLDAENAVIFASGESVVNIHAGTNLSLNVSDTAKVTYTGTPENVNYSDGALATIKTKSKTGLSAN